MRTPRNALTPLLLSIFLLPARSIAQRGQFSHDLNMMEKGWSVAGTAKTSQGEPVRNATVTVQPLNGMGPKVLTTDAAGEFRTYYSMLAEELPVFSAVLTVGKKGYETAHAYVNYGQSQQTWWIRFTMHDVKDDEDADVLSSADFVAGLAPKLRQLGPADGLASKSAKEYARSVADFLDHEHPERAIPSLWKVAQSNPECIACRTMLGLAELDWHAWDDAADTFAEASNATLTNRKIGRPEPLVAYGVWLTWQHQPEKAMAFFVEALKLAPLHPLALQELGRTLLATGQFEAAHEYLKKAVASGAGPDARLLYAQSCAETGRSAEAASEMKLYLDGRDVKKMPLYVRQVWASVQNRERLAAAYPGPAAQHSHQDVDFIENPPANLTNGLAPATDQKPLTAILRGVGAFMSDMTANYPNTSSLELIRQEKLGGKGKVYESQAQQFRYLCIVPHRGGRPIFDEYRADREGTPAVPGSVAEGFMLTRGFTTSALVFHPDYRSESNFRYLGRESVDGRPEYVVAFAQIPSKSHLGGIFRAGESSVQTFSQGLAWIDAASYHITRLHTELLRSLPEMKLESESTDVRFDQVRFKSVSQAFWLPQQVTVEINWDRKELRNTHQYSDFQLFEVNTTQKVGKPSAQLAAPRRSPRPVTQ